MLYLNDTNFDLEVLQSKEPVLVDFFAEWCGPCQMLGPIVEELATEYEGKGFKVAKLNVDQANATAAKYEIMSIPTMMIFKDGQVAEVLVGLQSKEALKAKIEGYLK